MYSTYLKISYKEFGKHYDMLSEEQKVKVIEIYWNNY